MRYKNKYTLKAGVSLNDIGHLRFDRGTWGGGFDGITLDWDLDTFAHPLGGEVDTSALGVVVLLEN